MTPNIDIDIDTSAPDAIEIRNAMVMAPSTGDFFVHWNASECRRGAVLVWLGTLLMAVALRLLGLPLAEHAERARAETLH